LSAFNVVNAVVLAQPEFGNRQCGNFFEIVYVKVYQRGIFDFLRIQKIAYPLHIAGIVDMPVEVKVGVESLPLGNSGEPFCVVNTNGQWAAIMSRVLKAVIFRYLKLIKTCPGPKTRLWYESGWMAV
jgi:hypothetical protein